MKKNSMKWKEEDIVSYIFNAANRAPSLYWYDEWRNYVVNLIFGMDENEIKDISWARVGRCRMTWRKNTVK